MPNLVVNIHLEVLNSFLHGYDACGIIKIHRRKVMATEEYKKRKQEYISEYQRKFYSTISFKLRTVEDKEILDYLNSIQNKSDYIKQLIIKDMHGR